MILSAVTALIDHLLQCVATLLVHLGVSLRMPSSSHETRWIITNMKKQSSHTAYHKQCFVSLCDWCFYSLFQWTMQSTSVQLPFCLILYNMLFFQMFYASNLCHTCLVSAPFKVLPCSDQFAREKRGCCHSKISKFCHCNRNCESSIVLNPPNLDLTTLNNYIQKFNSIGSKVWLLRPNI